MLSNSKSNQKKKKLCAKAIQEEFHTKLKLLITNIYALIIRKDQNNLVTENLRIQNKVI